MLEQLQGTSAETGTRVDPMSSLKTSMQSHVLQYLFAEISLDDFTDWLVSATWNIDAEQDAEASSLAFSIERALAEASSGLLTPSELHTALREMVNP